MEGKEALTAKDIINDIILKYPNTIPIFNAFGVDSCCGGGHTLEKSASGGKIDLKALMSALNQEINKKK